MKNNRGFVSAHVLGIMVIASIAGAYLLRSASKEANTSGNFLQMRSAASSAEAGMADGLAQLETDTTLAMGMLRSYLKDDKHQWMLNSKGATATPNEMSLPGAGQTYSARIVAFDSGTGIIKIQAEGNGLNGSTTHVTGIYRLEGVGDDPAPSGMLHALYLAGDKRDINALIAVSGPAYFGGAVRFLPGSAGTNFNGTVHIAPSASGASSDFDATANYKGSKFSTDFDNVALIETRVYTHGSYQIRFDHNTAFQEDLKVDAPIYIDKGPMAMYINANVSGSSQINVNGYPVTHSGSLNVAKVTGASGITNLGTDIDLAAKTGVPAGPEAPVTVDISVIPPGKIFTLSQLGLPAALRGVDITNAYNTLTSAQLFGPFMVIDVDAPVSFVRSGIPSENSSTVHAIFLVHNAIAGNGNLPDVKLPGNWMFYVPSGGSVTDFGADGYFYGYVHVTGSGSVTYKWGGGNHMHGAIHHVTAQSGWGMSGPNGICLTLERNVLQEYADLGLLSLPVDGGTQPSGLRLTDVKIRPKLLSLYY